MPPVTEHTTIHPGAAKTLPGVAKLADASTTHVVTAVLADHTSNADEEDDQTNIFDTVT